MKIARSGVDLAKFIFHIHAVNQHDILQWQIKLKRGQWLEGLCKRLMPGA